MRTRTAVLAAALLLSVSSLGQVLFLQNPLLQSPANQPNPPAHFAGSLFVVVYRADGSPADDVRIEVYDLRGRQLVGSAYTNINGDYEFTNLSAGTCEVVATQGLSEVRDRVDMHGGFASLNLRLPAAAGVSQAGSSSSVSVAQYQVPAPARQAFRKAQKAASQQKIEEAKKYLAQALETYPHFAEALTLRAILHLDAQELQAAQADLEKAVACDHAYALGYVVLGAVYNLQRRFDDALRMTARGVALSPAAWQGYFELGKAYIGKADYLAALSQLRQAEQRAPKNYAPIHLLKAHAWLALNSYPQAMAELQAFLERAPHSDPQSKQAQAMLDKVKAFTAKH